MDATKDLTPTHVVFSTEDLRNLLYSISQRTSTIEHAFVDDPGFRGDVVQEALWQKHEELNDLAARLRRIEGGGTYLLTRVQV